MENETTKKPLLIPAIQAGVIIALVLIIYSIAIYLLNLSEVKSLQWISFILLIAALVFFARKYRQEQMGGYISYGKTLGFSTLSLLFASLLSAVYTFVFFKFIDNKAIQHLKDITEEKYYEMNMSEEQINQAMMVLDKVMTPVGLTISGFFNTFLIGFLVILITSIFIAKKERTL